VSANGEQSSIVNAMTVDVEDYFHVSALSHAIDRNSWESIEPRVEASTDKLLEMFGERSHSGTFFILGWVAERHPALVRRIVDAGHEVACHGYSHQLIYRQDQREFEEETRRAKEILEDVAGVRVRGYRAASYSITRDSLWAVRVLVEAGFDYDSSIVPVRHDLYGLADGQVFPHRLEFEDGQGIVEFPPSTIQLLRRRIPIGGGGYFRIFPYWFTRWGLDSINRDLRMPFSFYLHPWEVDPEQPRVAKRLKSKIRHYTNLHRTEPRLRRLQERYAFTTMAEVIDSLELPRVPLSAGA
jgi:polysaccharide deacetylase family protein (PEP-CTERM system associated)